MFLSFNTSQSQKKPFEQKTHRHTVAIEFGDLSDKMAPEFWPNGQTAIHLAASYGFVALVEKLMRKHDTTK